MKDAEHHKTNTRKTMYGISDMTGKGIWVIFPYMNHYP
ncbi:hypothetical protein EZS27_005061 [termite gut metagenome]|uniref:Uncharacterized protein n=1 Tax=termite gut metagenome TaxID=433724 RepID=A0A5J4SMI9_9ZZZZ